MFAKNLRCTVCALWIVESNRRMEETEFCAKKEFYRIGISIALINHSLDLFAHLIAHYPLA